MTFARKILLSILILLCAFNVYALRVSRPTEFQLPWTEEQINDLNNTLSQLFLMQKGRYEQDEVASVKTGANNGEMWLHTSVISLIQYKSFDDIYEVLAQPYSATDRIDIDDDGQITLSGNARVKKYLIVPSGSFRLGGAAPDKGVEGTFSTLLFSSALTESAYFNVHLPADWSAGTDLHLAVYWAPTSAAAGGVAWEADWEARAAESNEALGAGSTHIDMHDATQSLDNELLESHYGVITGASLALDDTIGILFYRDHDDGTDNYGADAALIHVEIEYIADKLGEPL